jgi:membrane-associated phospholipid phosphatase
MPWPVDKLLVSYLALTAVLILFFSGRIPHAGWLVVLHAAGILVIALTIQAPKDYGWYFRHWYPMLYVAACYREMSLLIQTIRRTDFDRALAQLDLRLWGANPTVWLERIQSPWLTEILQVVYSLFVPAVLLVAALLWWQRKLPEFRYYTFLISLGFLVSYAGYFLIPARGPRFSLAHLQHIPLQGLWFFDFLQANLDRLEAAHYDCFPSGHVELTVLAWWGARQISAIWSRAFFVYTWCIIFATVYLRYHYTIDLFAGVAVAVAALMVSPYLYRSLGKGS